MSDHKNTEVNQPEPMGETSDLDIDLDEINQIGKYGIGKAFQFLSHDFKGGMGEFVYTYCYGNYTFDNGVMSCDTIRQTNILYRDGSMILVSEEVDSHFAFQKDGKIDV